jgi:hypothetical protein
MARRGCVDRAGGYDESLEASEDWSLWLRVARHCRFAFIDRVLARFRFHGENLTSATSPQLDEVLQNRLYVLDRFFAQPDLAANILAMRPIAYRNVYTFIAMRYLSARRPRQALGPVWRSLRTGCNPVVSLARNIWFIVAYEYFGNVAWIRTLAARVADLQSRRRRRLPRSR